MLINQGRQQQGFTLIELIAVIIIFGILAVSVRPTWDTNASREQAARDDLVGALIYAQQVAMARDAAGKPITFRVSADGREITVQENGVDLTASGIYPFTLSNGATVGPVDTILQYDKLGGTSATVFTLNGGTTVSVTASGYANY